MNITVIHGSMRKGNTYSVTGAVLERLRERGDVTITEFRVGDLDLPFCISCHTCFTKGEDYCPHSEALKPVRDALEASDGIILSGVCYAMHLNAAMKNFADHFAYYFHRPRMFNKSGMVITTTAGAGDSVVAKYLRQTLGHWGVGKAYILPVKIRTEKFSLTDKQAKRVNAAADRFYSNIKNRKLRPPSFSDMAVHNAFRASSSIENPISECDAAYWKASGFSERSYPRKTGFVKTFAGWFIYKFMRSFFIYLSKK